MLVSCKKSGFKSGFILFLMIFFVSFWNEYHVGPLSVTENWVDSRTAAGSHVGHTIAAPTLPAVICKWRGLKMLRFSIISIWLPISALNFRIFSKMLYFLVWWSFTYSWKFVFGIFYCKFGRKFSIIEFYAWKAAALIMKSSTTCTTSKTSFLEFYKLLISAPIKN